MKITVDPLSPLPTFDSISVLQFPCLIPSFFRFHRENIAIAYSLVLMFGHTYSKSMDQPGKVANPARRQLNRENEYFPVRVRA